MNEQRTHGPLGARQGGKRPGTFSCLPPPTCPVLSSPIAPPPPRGIPGLPLPWLHFHPASPRKPTHRARLLIHSTAPSVHGTQLHGFAHNSWRGGEQVGEPDQWTTVPRLVQIQVLQVPATEAAGQLQGSSCSCLSPGNSGCRLGRRSKSGTQIRGYLVTPCFSPQNPRKLYWTVQEQSPSFPGKMRMVH